MLISARPHCSASSASAPGRSGRVVRTRQSMRAGCAREVALPRHRCFGRASAHCRIAVRHAWRHDRGADRGADRARPATPSGPIVRAERLVGRWVDSRWTVAVAAAAAFLLRLPGLTRPVRADEAGYQLVARAWHPHAGQRVRRLLRGPAAADDRALQALRRDRRAAVHPGAGRGRVRRAGARGRGGGPAGRRRARRALDRGRDGRAQHQRAHRRGGGEGRAARAAGADGQPRAVAGGGPGPVLARWRWPPGSWPGWRSASSRTSPAGSSSPRSSSSGRGGPGG